MVYRNRRRQGETGCVLYSPAARVYPVGNEEFGNPQLLRQLGPADLMILGATAGLELPISAQWPPAGCPLPQSILAGWATSPAPPESIDDRSRGRLARKGAGKEAKLCYSANALMENGNTILIDFQVEPTEGTAKRRAALAMADERLPGRRRITLGGDRGYDTRGFVGAVGRSRFTAHVAQNRARPGGSALDARTVRHFGYAPSQL